MTKAEAVNWIINLTADIGKIEHQSLWHYEQALSEIREMLEIKPERKTGKWIIDDYDDEYAVCDKCGEPCATYVLGKPWDRFCKRCGAKMEVEHEAKNT